MIEKVYAHNLGYLDEHAYEMTSVECDIELPKECPCCNRSTVPQVLDSYALKYENKQLIELTTMFFCRGCEKVFLGNYVGTHNEYEDNNLLDLTYLSPYSEKCSAFSEEIQKLSNEFVELYNQAEKAEAAGLDKICGIAYRKALEFLVKDFAVFMNNEKTEQIKSLRLSKCISDYITNEKIRTLAKAATWIGNDETHYIRVHEDYSVTEMKAFIKAMLTYVDSELQVIKAEKLINN